MKKVKIMLTAVAVMAVVGGALAFKANKLNTKLFCTSQAGVGACTIEKKGFSFTWTEVGQQSAGSSTCLDAQGNCVETTTYVNE